MESTTTAATNTPLGIAPMSPDFRRDPYPYYERLRREAPVHLSQFGFWSVASYDDVAYVLKTPQIFSSAGMGGPTNLPQMRGAEDGGGTPMRSIISRIRLSTP